MSPEIKLAQQRSIVLTPITPEIDQAINNLVTRGRIELAREQSKAWGTLPTFNRTGKKVVVNF